MATEVIKKITALKLAGIITFTGIGAGVILKDGQKIRGLTTAATLWCDAAIGTLCAGGAIPEAILGTILILFSNIILRYVNKLINNLEKLNLSTVKNYVNSYIDKHNRNEIDFVDALYELTSLELKFKKEKSNRFKD